RPGSLRHRIRVRFAYRGGRGAGQGPDRPGWDVGGEQGQLAIGPRDQRLARARVEFIHGQPALHERRFEELEHLFPVGGGGPQVTVGTSGRPVTPWSCRHQRLPHTNRPKRNPGGCDTSPPDPLGGPARAVPGAAEHKRGGWCWCDRERNCGRAWPARHAVRAAPVLAAIWQRLVRALAAAWPTMAMTRQERET